MTKVFGIGFHKTGTSSLRAALEILGYKKVANYSPQLLPAIKAGKWEEVFAYADQFEAYEDNPWPLLYQEMDEQYPGSKFVLSYRDPEAWIKSAVNHFGSDHTDMREWIYGVGSPLGNEKVYLDRYQKHFQEVKEYFADRPQDLAIMDWKAENNWLPLCHLLDMKVPTRSFPRTNTARHRSLWGRVQLKVQSLFD